MEENERTGEARISPCKANLFAGTETEYRLTITECYDLKIMLPQRIFKFQATVLWRKRAGAIDVEFSFDGPIAAFVRGVSRRNLKFLQ